ncbi:protein-glutamate O-methyltransferase CheR [bacterium]|jgi:chemotaxis protein methyltransferase CheR|nr:protein-glutamate O-methyltransferase CheR [bacterium]
MNPITDAELAQFQRFIFDEAGISLSAAKKALVMGRLGKRLTHHHLESFGDYFRLLESGQHPDEVQTAVDLLTTNETYFFREIKHFDFLREQALAARQRGQAFRVWSAASSSGEEAYSISMVLAETMGSTPWEVVGTDISTRMVQDARRALYPMERARHVPEDFLRKYCRKGIEQYAGKLLIDRSLRNRVRFVHANLNAPLPEIGRFDFIFLRNVMIYFNNETKQQVVNRVASLLKPDGYFLVGHSESLNDVTQAVRSVAPAIYRKAA